MTIVTPLTKEKAASSVHGLYDAFTQKFGFMPNIMQPTRRQYPF